jgi:hypothetical protein
MRPVGGLVELRIRAVMVRDRPRLIRRLGEDVERRQPSPMVPPTSSDACFLVPLDLSGRNCLAKLGLRGRFVPPATLPTLSVGLLGRS